MLLYEANKTQLSNTSMVYNIAIFGLGRIGKIHLNILTSNRKVNVSYLVEHDDFLPSTKDYLKKENYHYTTDTNAENRGLMQQS